MALTPVQLAARAGKLTGSRIACLMGQDPETDDARLKREKQVHQLWLEMTGQAEPVNLRMYWPAVLGSATEHANLEWFETKNNCVIADKGEFYQHPTVPWAGVTLDGWYQELNCPIECKQVVNPRETSLPDVIARFQPQVQWQIECTGAAQCALSIIMGVQAPVVEFIERNKDYAEVMKWRGEQFMAHVRNKTPPVIFAPAPAPIIPDRIVDMNGNAEWKRLAEQWLQVHGAAEVARDCDKGLKALVPPEAKQAHGHGVNITKDRAGRQYLRE